MGFAGMPAYKPTSECHFPVVFYLFFCKSHTFSLTIFTIHT